MAYVFSDYGINDATIDMNLLIRNQTAHYFDNNVNAELNGIFYEDIAILEYRYGDYWYDDVFGGFDMIADAEGRITDGTVTSYIETIWNGSYWVSSWGIEDITYPASVLIGTAYTTDTSDEHAVMAHVLSGDDWVYLSNYNDQVHTYGGNDVVEAGYGFDTVYAGSGNDYVQGGTNGDRIFGEDGSDDLRGGSGLDYIDAGAGDDFIRGAKGTDTLTGGSGSDTFIFEKDLDGVINVDIITDFEPGIDYIELSATVFRAFSAQIGQFVEIGNHLNYNANSGVLEYDADGTGPEDGLPFVVLGTSTHPAAAGIDIWISY